MKNTAAVILGLTERYVIRVRKTGEPTWKFVGRDNYPTVRRADAVEITGRPRAIEAQRGMARLNSNYEFRRDIIVASAA